jgi:NMD protein affecting ribosome stability and mRNA decay
MGTGGIDMGYGGACPNCGEEENSIADPLGDSNVEFCQACRNRYKVQILGEISEQAMKDIEDMKKQHHDEIKELIKTLDDTQKIIEQKEKNLKERIKMRAIADREQQRIPKKG